MADDGDFRDWYAGVAQKLNAKKRTIDPDPDAPEHFYDYRAFHRDMKAGKDIKPPSEPGGHWPSDYKTIGHPRTYLDDTTGRLFETKTAKYLTGEPVPGRKLRASQNSDDLPEIASKSPEELRRLAEMLTLSGRLR